MWVRENQCLIGGMMTDLLEQKIARLIFLAMKPANMIMADWDSGAMLGKDNWYRNRIMMAANLIVIEITSDKSGKADKKAG